MSTALAIAAVTRVLKDLLNDGLINNNVSGSTGGNVTVSALPPDLITDPKANQLNLFMYQVTPNQGWSNMGLPSRSSSGERVANPPLALDLHYLLTAYGGNELHGEILLGYGMQSLHETPILVRDAIRTSLSTISAGGAGGLPAGLQMLSTSELAEQIEQIKISLVSLSTEEISKLWSAFQSKYRPTAAYRASVVLIESRKSTKSALPVRARKAYVSPFKQPVIEKLMSQKASGDEIAENQQILAGYILVIAGKRLRGEKTNVTIGGIHVAPQAENISDDQIVVPLPPGLRAGIQGVQVIHEAMMGEPPEPHQGVESNITAFVLHPEIIGPITILSLQDQGNNLYSGIIRLSVTPAVGEKQRVLLLLNELRPETGSPPESQLTEPLSYSFSLSPVTVSSPPEPGGSIEIPFKNVRSGMYLARIRVDGAESPLGTDMAGRYNSPLLSIPPITSP